MSRGYKIILSVLILAFALSLGGMFACGEEPSGQTETPVEPNESIITGKLVAARVLSEAFPWEIDVEIYSSIDIPGYTNLTEGKVGEVITARTREYPLGFGIGQSITAHVRLEGDEQESYYYAWEIY
jgi:hypothetical protein